MNRPPTIAGNAAAAIPHGSQGMFTLRGRARRGARRVGAPHPLLQRLDVGPATPAASRLAGADLGRCRNHFRGVTRPRGRRRLAAEC